MSNLYYDFNLKDPEIKKQFENEVFSFTMKLYESKIVALADGAVAIDITGFTTVKGLYIKSAGAITATINGQAVAVSDFIFMTLTALTSLTISCSNATGYLVDIVVWGV